MYRNTRMSCIVLYNTVCPVHKQAGPLYTVVVPLSRPFKSRTIGAANFTRDFLPSPAIAISVQETSLSRHHGAQLKAPLETP